MAIAGGIVGLVLGLVLDVASPWSEVIMGAVQTTLATPSVQDFPGLPFLVHVLGVFFAYVFLPLVGCGIGIKLGSST